MKKSTAEKRPKAPNRDVDFLFEAGALRHAQRAWTQLSGGFRMATVPEHVFRVALIALIIAEREGGVDTGRLLAMALLHDLPESRTVDHAHVHKAYIEEREELAIEHIFAHTALAALAGTTLAEYKRRESLEARIVKDADNIDIDLELHELADRGSPLKRKWEKNRRHVRDAKLYTKSARELWDAIQTADPDDWHVAANKWLFGAKNGK